MLIWLQEKTNKTPPFDFTLKPQISLNDAQQSHCISLAHFLILLYDFTLSPSPQTSKPSFTILTLNWWPTSHFTPENWSKPAHQRGLQLRYAITILLPYASTERWSHSQDHSASTVLTTKRSGHVSQTADITAILTSFSHSRTIVHWRQAAHLDWKTFIHVTSVCNFKIIIW